MATRHNRKKGSTVTTFVKATQASAQVLKLQHVTSDTKVAQSRPPNKTIHDHKQLTIEDKVGLFDLAHDFATVLLHQQRIKKPDPKRILRRFYAKLFSSWSTIKKNNPYAVLGDRSLPDTSIQVGELRRNCGMSEARKAGAPVYLGLSLTREKDCIEWMWKDQQANLVKFSLVTLKPDLTIPQARAEAIHNYDNMERVRITTFNIERIICAARRRLVEWARLGSGAPRTYRPEDAAGHIMPLLLARQL
ncbi:hypothetical protein FSARC_8696 [Fusarium sarcochroum]|uniref:Uncharacterized protein n=1 Tax=Fusarium sarcochroum TaxID=1208366 RepID=A0A8H4TST2_9HYPO|nr:hypothetical protein FSARC_8696 [Fusarium sarcochroum]